MKLFRTALVSAIIALSSSIATAQPFLGIHVSGSMQVGNEFKPFGLRAIFDTGASPDTVEPNSVHFNAEWGEVIDTSALASTTMASPFGVLEDGYIPADIEFVYLQGKNIYRLVTDVKGDPISFNVGNPIGVSTGGIGLAMTSLPKSLIDYQVIHSGGGGLSSGPLTFLTSDGIALWYGGSVSNTGTIHVTFQFVDGPPEPECLADINNDGFIDFFDISAYLQLYSDGCP